jgi:metallo-beta-lactamase class B
LVGAADRALVESGGRNDPQFGDAFAWPPVKVDRALRDGDTVKLGGVELQVHATPGHTAGVITCTQTVRQGDKDCAVVFVGSVSCPDYKLVGNPLYPGVANDFVRTFKTLNSLPCDVFLTEHGWDCDLAGKMKRLDFGDANPFIDPDGYHRYLAGAEKRFEDLFRKQSAAPNSKN